MKDVRDKHNAIEEARWWGCVFFVSVSLCLCQMLDARVGDKCRDWAGTGLRQISVVRSEAVA